MKLTQNSTLSQKKKNQKKKNQVEQSHFQTKEKAENSQLVDLY